MNLNPLKNIDEKLLDEAIEALSFALRCYNEYHATDNENILKQTIINIQRFNEYSLLYFLAKINPLLIFKNSFEEKNITLENSKTIEFDKMLNFYIHNYEMKSINTTKQPNKFRFKLIKLKNLRNSCMHLFMPPDDEELHKALADTLELMYIIYLENNLHKTIESKLTPEESNLLDSLIDTEAAKLNEAYQKVERYKKERQKYHHKSYNPYAAPVFECPMCMNETLIQPQTKDYLFICTNCEHEEKAGSCSVSATCPGSYMPIPQCYLSDWNEDSMICEECLNYINNL